MAASGKGAGCAQPYSSPMNLSRIEEASEAPLTDAGFDTRKCGKLALAPARAAGCNPPKQRRAD
jgi:hypothetical protein